MEFTPENVEGAVVEFYRNQGKVNRDCHEWLKTCQSSQEAWHVVWPLLEPNKVLQVQFVAANMLHYKVSRCLGEVPESEYPALKDRLVAAVAKYISGPSVVLTRLGLTLGAFVTNTIGTFWKNPLEDLATIFSPQNFPGVPETNVLRLLVQVFGFIPEQAQSQWQHTVRKGQEFFQLQSKGESMFNWLFNVVRSQQNSMELVLEALKAMNSWMKMFRICEWAELSKFVELLVNYCGSSVSSEEDRLCELTLEILSGIIADPNAHLYPTIVLSVLERILPLQSSLDIILQRQDMELASSFYGMYVALSDCHSKLVVEVCDPESVHNKEHPQNRENVLNLIGILLRCTDCPGTYPIDEIVSSITISVWYSFVEDIQPKQTEGMKYVRIMQVFEEVYKSLAKILIKKACYPINTSDWNSEEKEQFRVYRQDVCDCLTYCFELRGWTMLNELVDTTEAHLMTIETDPQQIRHLWPELESLLMGIRAVAENISDETDPLVVGPMTRVFSVIFRILKLNREQRNAKLFQAAIECISSCSGMLHMYDAVVKNMIGFILEGLFEQEISTSAALALKTLSRDCSRNLSEFTPQILSSCKQALDSGSLTQNDCARLVFCIGKFLPFLPNEQIIAAVNEIFSPALLQLQSIAGQEPKAELKSQLVNILNILSTLCSSLDNALNEDEEDESEEISEAEQEAAMAVNNNNATPSQNQNRNQPLIPIVEQILPILVPLAEKWARDEEVMEALFAILKHTLSTIHTASPAVIQYSIQLVLISFRLNPLMSATALAKQTLLMLGKENFQTQTQFIGEMHRLCVDRLKSIRDTDFIESYFQLIAQLTRNNPDLINAAGISLDILLQIAIESLNCMEASMLKASIFFTTVTIDKAAVLRPSLIEYFKQQGQTIIQKILVAIGYTVSRANCHNFADLILVLNRTFTVEWRKWLSDGLARHGFPSVHINQEMKNRFFTKVTKERVNKRAVQDAINEFAIACRNISGTEYAASTSKRL